MPCAGDPTTSPHLMHTLMIAPDVSNASTDVWGSSARRPIWRGRRASSREVHCREIEQPIRPA